MKVVAVTISLEIKDVEYGNGASRYISMRSEDTSSPEDPNRGVTLDAALDQSLDMHLACWHSINAARVAGDNLAAPEFKEAITRFDTRIASAKRYLNKIKNEGETDGN